MVMRSDAAGLPRGGQKLGINNERLEALNGRVRLTRRANPEPAQSRYEPRPWWHIIPNNQEARLPPN